MQLTNILTMVAEKTNQVTAYNNGSNTAMKATFIRGINRAYKRLCKEKYKLDYSESVTLDSDKCFNPFGTGVLTKDFIGIKRVVDEIDDSDAYKVVVLQNDKWQVIGATASGSVLVCYYYMPAELSGDTDEPVIPDHIIDTEVYADFAAGYYFETQRKINEANRFYLKFDNAIELNFTKTSPKKLLYKPM